MPLPGRSPRRLTYRQEWLRRILHLTPSWFSINMGTGIVSILLYNLPYQFPGLRIIATVIFLLNVLIFFWLLILSVLRYIIWREVLGRMLVHPTQSLFLGTLPMGFITICNMVVFTCAEPWGGGWIIFAWVLWWIDTVVAVLVAIVVPFLMFHSQKNHELSNMTAAWLLPSVSCVVGAAGGAIVAGVLAEPYPSHAALTVVISYIMFGIGFCPAVLIMAVYVQRLVVHKLPPSTVIVSTFLPLGPCGQGAFVMLKLSSVVRTLCNNAATAGGTSIYTADELRMFGAVVYAGSIPFAMVIYGLGFFWLCIAVSSIFQLSLPWSRSLKFSKTLPFNMGWWGFTFPLGVWTTATTQFGAELDSRAFKIFGTILSGCVVLLWLVVGVLTLVRAWTGILFMAPCLAGDEARLLGYSIDEESEETASIHSNGEEATSV